MKSHFLLIAIHFLSYLTWIILHLTISLRLHHEGRGRACFFRFPVPSLPILRLQAFFLFPFLSSAVRAAFLPVKEDDFCSYNFYKTVKQQIIIKYILRLRR